MPDSSRTNGSSAGPLMLTATALMALGLVAVASSTMSLDRPLFGSGFWHTPLGRQLVFALAGAGLMVLTSRLAVPFLKWEAARYWGPRILFVLTMAGLMAAMIPRFTSAHGGAHRWFRFKVFGWPLGLQPSEPAKVALVVVLGSLLTTRGADPRSLRRCFLPASFAIGVCVAAVGVEDFGTAALLAVVGLAMLFVAGCLLRYLTVLGLLGAAGLAVLVFIAPYRLERIAAYLDFSGDPRGAGYQPLQSLATVASGGWLGTGLGLGVQKHGYLPACHTDFIFAVICEETGVLGAVLVMALFGLVIWFGLRIMWAARSRFERLVAFGLTATIGLQAVMNIAVVTALTPTTGIPLPLISVGGSGVLTFSIGLGLLAAIARNSAGAPGARERPVYDPRREWHGHPEAT